MGNAGKSLLILCSSTLLTVAPAMGQECWTHLGKNSNGATTFAKVNTRNGQVMTISFSNGSKIFDARINCSTNQIATSPTNWTAIEPGSVGEKIATTFCR